MLVVLGIIIVLAGIAVALTLRIDNQSKENALTNAFAVVGSSLREYYDFKGQFPPQPQRIVWPAQPTAPQYQTSLAQVLGHVEAMVQELRSVPASRQVLDQVSATLVKSEGGPADLQSIMRSLGNRDRLHLCPGRHFSGTDLRRSRPRVRHRRRHQQ